MNSTQKPIPQGCPGVAEYRHQGAIVTEHAGGCCRAYTVAFTATDITPAFILRAAALYIERHGWHQGALYPEHHNRHHRTTLPPACAIGAIRIAVTGRITWFRDDLTNTEAPLVRRAEKVLAGHLDHCDDTDREVDATTVISTWNDEDWRTATDVTTELRAAADDWDHIHATTGGAQ
jgi:hypothetical protein